MYLQGGDIGLAEIFEAARQIRCVLVYKVAIRELAAR